MTNMIIIFSACPTEEEAAQIAQSLVEHRLAACVQISAPIRSVYRWKGELQREQEWLLSIKTQEGRFEEVKAYLEENHSYKVPEIVAIPAARVSDRYLEWLNAEVSH